jgi:hypothetical protein
LLGDSDRSSVHFDTIPRFISLKLRKKSFAHGDLVFDLNVRITPAKLNIMGSNFYWKLSKVRYIFSKNFIKIECSGKKIDF